MKPSPKSSHPPWPFSSGHNAALAATPAIYKPKVQTCVSHSDPVNRGPCLELARWGHGPCAICHLLCVTMLHTHLLCLLAITLPLLIHHLESFHAWSATINFFYVTDAHRLRHTCCISHLPITSR